MTAGPVVLMDQVDLNVLDQSTMRAGDLRSPEYADAPAGPRPDTRGTGGGYHFEALVTRSPATWA